MPDDITDPCPERAARQLYEGPGVGGPLDQAILTSRFPQGIVAVDKPTGRAWIYDYAPAGEGAPARFTARDATGESLDDAKRWRAADGGDYDVVAVA